MTILATVEKLAPTGEGIVRTREGVGLVSGALPGEDVEVEIVRASRKIWRGRTVSIRTGSALRRTGGHADGCPACDWAHLDLSAAREAKRELFLETMARIGRLPSEIFGALPVEPSPLGYRLRSRFHAQPRGGTTAVGAFAPGTHRVEPLDECLALAEPARASLQALSQALSSAGAISAEIATIETLDGRRRLARVAAAASPEQAARIGRSLASTFAGTRVVDSAGRLLHRAGDPRLWIPVRGRELAASPGRFFQANRFLLDPLAACVAAAARAVSPGRALDAFGGSGLFAAALLDAGHAVTSVEGDTETAQEARLARDRWGAGKRWRIERGSVLEFAISDAGREDVVVADPPRAGLGLPLARALASRARERLIYVSCDPATLARDLSVILPEGWEILEARLFDLFALTHRIEAVVALGRPGAA